MCNLITFDKVDIFKPYVIHCQVVCPTTSYQADTIYPNFYIMKTSKSNNLKKIDRTAYKMRKNNEAKIITPEKKSKIEGKIKVPNELWMKIMNFLPTKDIFTSFALVNKHFHNLTMSPSSIKYLQIKDIDNDFDFDKVIEVVNRSIGLKELLILECPEYWHRFVFRAMQASIQLNSLKISMNPKGIIDLFGPLAYRLSFPTYDSQLTCNPELMEMIVQSSKLTILELNGIILTSEAAIKVCQMRHLKSLRLSHQKSGIVTPNLINELSQNCDKLEKIEILSLQSQKYCNCDQFRKAIDNLFEKNQSTLKTIMFDVCSECDSLLRLSFNQSQVLQELNQLNSYINDVEVMLFALGKFQNSLTKLILHRKNPTELEKLLSTKMNLPNLKYLAIHGGGGGSFHAFNTARLFQGLAKNQFPNLERLYVESDKSIYFSKPLALTTFKRLITFTKNMKSIQFDDTSVSEINIPNKYLFDLFSKSGIFVIFGKVNETKFSRFYREKETKIRERQKEFEEYLKCNSVIWGKYQIEKHRFAKWCRENEGYGY